ncbi:TRAP dicarboxylate transporter subunit DctP [Salinisphaera dokdonensis CL-ES53]|uniref:TRAP dicarboxylate transporter subunit DctP n=1 Tax=Salinisphaera dokdonensis CL-ES53 TaxID=1304272 RepID=A0ABV2B0W7_9GAMM
MKTGLCKYGFRWLAGLSVVWLIAAGAAAAQDKTYTLRIHHFFPSTAPVNEEFFVPWAKAVEEESNGRIEVQIYPSMQLGGSPATLFDQAESGQVDIIWTVLGYAPGRFRKAEVFDLPFLPTTGEATSKAAHAYAMEHMQDELKGVYPIAVHTHSPGAIHTRGEPVKTMSDMRGLKLRGPTRVINTYLANLGAQPVGMPVSQAPEALSRGVIDGTVVPFEAISALGLAKITDQHTVFSGDHALYTTMMMVAMNQDRYDSLPEDLQAVIDAHSGIEAAAKIGRIMDDADQVEIDRIDNGELPGQIVTVGPEETAKWQAVGQKITDDWIEKNSDRLPAQELYDDARRLIEKYNAE